MTLYEVLTNETPTPVYVSNTNVDALREAQTRYFQRKAKAGMPVSQIRYVWRPIAVTNRPPE